MLKVVINKSIKEEIDIALPLYLYLQDDEGRGEAVKITKTHRTSIKSTYFGYVIGRTAFRGVVELREWEDNERVRSTREVYEEYLQYAKEFLNKL